MDFDDYSASFGEQYRSDSPRSRRRKMRRKRSGRALTVFLVVLLLFSGLIYAGYQFTSALIAPVTADEGGKQRGFFKRDSGKETFNVLLFGTDERGSESGRSDTIILAVLDLEKKTAKMLSIPRDTRVEIAGEGKVNKINYAHAKGGPVLAIETVENFLGLPVDGYVETNFAGFKEIVDTIGGVTIEVEKRMYKPEEDIDLQPGLQRLDGKGALAYVRWRGDAMGDIGRIERQQKFFLAVADELLQVNNIWKLPDLVREFRTYVKTDLSLTEMLRVATAMKDIDRSRISVYTVPGYPEYIDEISYWIPAEIELEQMIEEIKETGPPATADEQQTTGDKTG